MLTGGVVTHYWGAKFSHYCLKYEVACNPKNGLICWVAGPAPGALPDGTLFLRYLRPRLSESEYVLGDPGYRHTPNCITTWKKMYETPEEKWRLHRLTVVRNKIERVNRYLRSWNCIKQPWRHQILKHPCTFHVVAQLTQLTFLHKTSVQLLLSTATDYRSSNNQSVRLLVEDPLHQ